MTATEALQRVYEYGDRCQRCEHKIVEREPERLPGRRTEYTTWRGCAILESQNYTFPREAIECPGVELARNEE